MYCMAVLVMLKCCLSLTAKAHFYEMSHATYQDSDHLQQSKLLSHLLCHAWDITVLLFFAFLGPSNTQAAKVTCLWPFTVCTHRQSHDSKSQFLFLVLFQIDGSTGAVSTKLPLDRERIARWESKSCLLVYYCTNNTVNPQWTNLALASQIIRTLQLIAEIFIDMLSFVIM